MPRADLSHSVHRLHRRQRRRWRRRRAYIRSVYFLPSLATLGNAVCGFAAIYVAALDPNLPTADWLTARFAEHRFTVAAYLIFFAMVFDALDGRLARFARHTTDFGGQLDSLADVLSFGAAPAFLALQTLKAGYPDIPTILSRLIWAVGALFMSCAAMRLARFNVSNEHGEQHHFSFLGLPSPGAGAAVAALVLLQQYLLNHGAWRVSAVCLWVLPPLVLATGLLMVSAVRYPHVINRYLRGKRPVGRLVTVLVIALLFVVAHQVTLAVGAIGYALYGPAGWLMGRWRKSGVVREDVKHET
jgi:CDP-diacylglycerol--serine O-phosphatidyltransferase